MSKVKLSVFRNDQLVDSYEFQIMEGVEQEAFIGRASDCHISLADHQVSRHHVSLTYSSGILSLKNLSQYQNVYVNGKNVNNALVSDTDSIQFYDYTLKIEGAMGLQDIIPDDIDSLLNQVEKTQIIQASDEVEDTVVMSQENSNKNLKEENEVFMGTDISESTEQQNFESEESGPLVKGNDDIKTITQRIQNILSGDDSEDSNDFDINETDFIVEEKKERVSEVLEFGSEIDEGTEVGALQTFGEDTSVIDKFAQIYLSISGDNVPYHKYILEAKETLVGSSRKSCDIVLEDELVSEIHSRFLYDKKRVWVEDLGSDSGTYVNGDKVNKAELNQGDEILIGGISFVLMVGSEILSEEVKRLMPIAHEQEMIEHQMVGDENEAEEYSLEGELPEGASIQVRFQRMLANPQQKRIFYYVVAILFILLLFEDGEDNSNKVAKKKTKTEKTTEQPKGTTRVVKKSKRSQEELEYLESHYQLAKAKIEEGDYDGALFDAELVRTVDPGYKNIDSIVGVAKQGLIALEEAERKKKEEEERLEVESKIKSLLAKAEQAMKDDKLIMAETYLNEIAQFDPENSNLYSLKLEIDAAKKEQERLRKEQEEKERKRNEFLAALAPAKSLFAQGDWYKASKIVDKIITMKGIEAELINDANKLLKEAQGKISEETQRLLTEARGFRQGEDLKNAYETYLKLLKVNPISSEALKELQDIQSSLDGRAKLVYREALVSESISLFDDAKEKYLEVLQIAPSESDYYKKAKSKLDEFYVE